MIHKIERWAWWGGALLAGNAGLVNAVGLQSYAHQAVTHVTGTTSLFSLALAHHDIVALGNLGLVLAAFTGGAALSGFITQNATLRLGRRYGVALLLESAMLAIAASLMRSHHVTGSYFASAACGLQNAMAGTYSGSVLRTTHLTGMFTDLGAAVGHLLRHNEVDWIRIRLCALLIGSFVIGGTVGCVLFDFYSYNTLYIPAIFTGAVAGVYTSYAHLRKLQSP